MNLQLSPIKTDESGGSLVISLDKEAISRWKSMRMTSMIYDVFMDEDRFEDDKDGTDGTTSTLN